MVLQCVLTTSLISITKGRESELYDIKKGRPNKSKNYQILPTTKIRVSGICK